MKTVQCYCCLKLNTSKVWQVFSVYTTADHLVNWMFIRMVEVWMLSISLWTTPYHTGNNWHIAAKLKSHTKLIAKLGSTRMRVWVLCSSHLCYSVRKYCWSSFSHTSLIDSQLHSSTRLISGCHSGSTLAIDNMLNSFQADQTGLCVLKSTIHLHSLHFNVKYLRRDISQHNCTVDTRLIMTDCNQRYYPAVRFPPISVYMISVNHFQLGQGSCLANLHRWSLSNQLSVNVVDSR